MRRNVGKKTRQITQNPNRTLSDCQLRYHKYTSLSALKVTAAYKLTVYVFYRDISSTKWFHRYLLNINISIIPCLGILDINND